MDLYLLNVSKIMFTLTIELFNRTLRSSKMKSEIMAPYEVSIIKYVKRVNLGLIVENIVDKITCTGKG